MSYFFAIILILVLVWMFFGDRIRQWLQRRMMEKVEDAFRAQMGMPSAKEERRQRKAAEKQARKSTAGQRRRDGTYYHPGPNSGAPSSQSVGDVIIPREYAEDVEYVEYKEFTSSTTVVSEENPASGRKTTRIVTESQVTDVEFVEIKK